MINMSPTNQNSSSNPKQKAGGQSATYAAALTTPQGVISEQPNTADVPQPPRDSSSTPRQKAGGQSVMYAAASTTPQGVISEQPNTAIASQPPKVSAASPDGTSPIQTGREERQPLVMSTSFIR